MDRHEVITRTSSVLDRFADRVPENVMRGLREMADVGEQGEAIDELVATLVVNHTPVTDDERTELAELATGVNLRLTRSLDDLPPAAR